MKTLFALCVVALALSNPITMSQVYRISPTENESQEVIVGILKGMGFSSSFGSISRCMTDVVDAGDDVVIGMEDMAGGTPKDELHAVEEFVKAFQFVLGAFNQCLTTKIPEQGKLERAIHQLTNIYSFNFEKLIINDFDISEEPKSMRVHYDIGGWYMVGYNLGLIVEKMSK